MLALEIIVGGVIHIRIAERDGIEALERTDQLAEATGKGFDMSIAVDSRDSMSWPWAW